MTARGLWREWGATLVGGVLLALGAAVVAGLPLHQPVRFELNDYSIPLTALYHGIARLVLTVL